MGTSAGITFKADGKTLRFMRMIAKDLDEITNSSGLGCACTPRISKNRGEDTYDFSAQTNWSYDGANGREFLGELKKMIAKRGVVIELLDEWEY